MGRIFLAALLIAALADAGPRRYRSNGRASSGAPFVTLLRDGQGYDATSGTLSMSDGTAVTVSRSGVMTCTDDSWATFTTVAANKPCVVGGALHVAPGGTNLALRSEELDNAAWASTIAGTGVAATVTANAGVSPDGATTAERVQLSLGGGTTTSDITTWRQDYAGYTSGTAYTFSVWIKSNTGASQVLSLVNFNTQSSNITVTTTWQRFSQTVTPGSTAGSLFGIRLRGGQSMTEAGVDVLAVGAQLETGSVATPYIPTLAATVTRGAQTTTVPTPAFVTNSVGSVSAHFLGQGSQVSNVRVIGFDGVSRLAVSGTTGVVASDGTAAPTRAGSDFTTAARFMGTSWEGSTFYIESDTGITSNAYDGTMGLGATIGIGATPAGGSGSYGSLSNICLGGTKEACR